MLLVLLLIVVGLIVARRLASGGRVTAGKIVYLLTLAISLYYAIAIGFESLSSRSGQGIVPWITPILAVLFVVLVVVAWLDFRKKYLAKTGQ